MKIKSKLKYIVLFSSVTAFTISVINKLIYISSTINNKINPNKGSFYNWRFGNIFYTKNGTGSPLLLIHDLDVCSSSSEWKSIEKELAKKHTVYTLDLLGCGRSDKPYLTYTNYLYVQLISDFIKNIIGHKTDVIASGASCSFTIMACHNDANIFNKLIVINPEDLFKLNYIPSNKSISLKALIDAPIAGTLIYNILFTKTKVKENILSKFYNSSIINNSYIDECYEAAHTDMSKGKYLFASIKGSYTNANIIHALKEIDNSVFIIGGSNEENIKTTIENYSYYNSAIESYIIKNTKHLPHLEAPNSLLEQINIFANS